ncbi:hypothetical protein [Nocardia brevicatena]|uniref:hypothetical protein n=1 Tax=Nocardia brevicatena TaxID=37327 RepID=UPI0002EC3DED|nr:hypothetical protein [Nocardia brevicatena]
MSMWRVLVCVVAALVVGGCATSMPERSADTTRQAGLLTPETPPEGGPPGLPGKTDAAEVPGAPFKIPPITLSYGAPIVAIEQEVRTEIAKKCDGCVTVEVQTGTDTTLSRCQFAEYLGAEEDESDPEAATPSLILKPGKQLILFTGALTPKQLPCDEDPDHYSPATSAPPTEPTPEVEIPSETVTPSVSPMDEPPRSRSEQLCPLCSFHAAP